MDLMATLTTKRSGITSRSAVPTMKSVGCDMQSMLLVAEGPARSG